MSCCQSVCLMFAVHVLKHNHLRFLAHLGSRLKLHLTVSMLMMMPPPELPRRRGNPSVVTKPDAKVIQRDLFKRFHVEKLYQKYRLLQTSTWPSASKLASTIRIEIVRRKGVKWMNEKEKNKVMRSSILTASAKLWLLRPSYGCFGQAMAASAKLWLLQHMAASAYSSLIHMIQNLWEPIFNSPVCGLHKPNLL